MPHSEPRLPAGNLTTRPHALFEPLESRVLFTSVIDIQGVENGALDQPRVHVLVRDPATGQALGGTGSGDLDDGGDVMAFLDTGSSGVLLAQETADALGLEPATQNGTEIVYSDVGVAGTDDFYESNPVNLSVAPWRTLFQESIDPTDYTQSFTNIRTQIAQLPADETIGEPLDILGMPALQNKVMVIDARPLNSDEDIDSLHTFIVNRGTPYNPTYDPNDLFDNPGIVPTNLHVKTSYGDFGRFTTVSPAGAPKPTLADNPFIGTSPVAPTGGGSPVSAPGITVARGSLTKTGSFLFDTGAASSFMSQAMANAVGVHYAAGTYGTESPQLLDASNNPVAGQFLIPIGGIGGTFNAAGFYLDSLTLPTTEGVNIRFDHAPILVLDVSVVNPTNGQVTTLDGDFGMNYLVATLDAADGGLGGGSAGAFDWVTFDQQAGVLGLALPDADVPPAVAAVTVNDGAAQRSMVKGLTVTFSEPVTVGAGAFALTRRDGTSLGATVTAANPSGDGQTWVLTFAGSSIQAGSLADGVYDLKVVATAVHAAANPATVMPADYAFKFHRLFSDADGDGDSDNFDLLQLRSTYLKPSTDAAYKWYFDQDNNGVVDNLDVFQIRSRRGIVFKGY